jgi:hypothetical protein
VRTGNASTRYMSPSMELLAARGRRFNRCSLQVGAASQHSGYERVTEPSGVSQLLQVLASHCFTSTDELALPRNVCLRALRPRNGGHHSMNAPHPVGEPSSGAARPCPRLPAPPRPEAAAGTAPCSLPPRPSRPPCRTGPGRRSKGGRTRSGLAGARAGAGPGAARCSWCRNGRWALRTPARTRAGRPMYG